MQKILDLAEQLQAAAVEAGFGEHLSVAIVNSNIQLVAGSTEEGTHKSYYKNSLGGWCDCRNGMKPLKK